MVTWSRDNLLSVTPAMDWQFQSPIDQPEWDQYCDFYRLTSLHADRPEVSHHAGLWSISQHQLVVQSWQWNDTARRKTAIVVHGYYDHVGLFGSLIDFCLQQGWNVVACDLPGHGLSSGEPATIDDFAVYDEVLHGLVCQLGLSADNRGHLFAQSMGAAISINYCLQRQLTNANSPFHHIALFAPLVRPAKWFKVQLLHSLLSPFLKTVKRGPTNSSNDPEFIDFINQDDPLQARYLSVKWLSALRRWIKIIDRQPACNIPIVVLQGDQEYTVDDQFNLPWIASKFPQQLRIALPGMRHHLVNETAALQANMYHQLRWSLSHFGISNTVTRTNIIEL